MIDLVQVLINEFEKEPSLVSLERKKEAQYYLNPSSSGVYNTYNNEAIGSCIKQVWLDKKDYPVSNPSSPYNKLNMEFGNMIEDWLIEKMKSSGLYLDSNVKIIDNELSLSGEIDILCQYPDTKEKFVIECKSYNGSNWNAAKDVLGSKDQYPVPKDGYILQVATYLILLRKYNIKEVYLFYIDKSCKSLYNFKQFRFYLKGDDILYDVQHQGKVITIQEDRFTVKDILERNSALLELLNLDYVPEPDFKMVYNKEEIEKAFNKGEISKSKYEKIKLNPLSEEVGSWQCAYCKFGKNSETGESTCINITNETKDFYK